jgi:O-antigen ligase
VWSTISTTTEEVSSFPGGGRGYFAEATLLLLLIILPAAFNPAGALAFEPLKTSFLRAAAVIIAVAWLAKPHRVDVGAHPIVRAGLVVVGVGALSTALSVEPRLSFLGSFDRGMGWLSLAAGGVLLLTAADVFSDDRRRERGISAVVLGAVVPCGYALLQRVGLDPVTWTTLGAPGSSMASPTFLGGYLVLVAPFAAYKTVCAGRSGAGLRYAGWLALLLVICMVILLTTIRGPILGLVAGAVGFVLLWRRQLGRIEIGAAVGVLVVSLALAGATGISGLQRFVNVARLGDSSVERLTVWGDAVRIPLGDPMRALVGFGPETQAAVLEHGEATVRLTQNQQWDRAHDLLLDTWLTGGLVGVAALLVLVGSAVRSVGRVGGVLPAAILAALVGHLVEVSFAFHTVVTGAWFWVVLGLAASLRPLKTQGASRQRAALVTVAAAAGLVLSPLMLAPAVADALYGSARRANLEVGAGLEELAAGWAPWAEELPRAAGLDWLQVANRRNDPAALARAEANLREAAARAPLEPVPHLRLVRFFLTHSDVDAAERECQLALTAGPYRAAVWDTCADVSATRGLLDEAPARRARAEELRRPR